MRLYFYAVITMVIISCNALFTRLAIIASETDPLSYGVITLLSALIVTVIVIPSSEEIEISTVKIWSQSLSLVALVYSLSYAYTDMSLSAGAVLMYGVAHASIIILGLIFHKEKLNPTQGFASLLTITSSMMAIKLLLNSQTAITAIISMVVAGSSWALFLSLSQKHNFSVSVLRAVIVRSGFLGGLVYIVFMHQVPTSFDYDGLAFGILCGAMTIGLGYSLWSLILPYLGLGATASTPVILYLMTILYAVVFLSEQLSKDYISATLLLFLGLTLSARSVNEQLLREKDESLL